MKAIIGLLVLGGLVLGGVYMFGGYGTLDPTAQGEAAKAKITPGMTLAQVLDAAGRNPKYQAIDIQKTNEGENVVEGPPVPFDDSRRQRIEKAIKNGEIPGGFNLLYHFSAQASFKVSFDAAGKVLGVEDEATVADLLHTRKNK